MSEQENITAVSDNKTTDNPQDKTNGSANGGCLILIWLNLAVDF